MKPDYERLLLSAKELRGWLRPSDVARGLTESGFDVSEQKLTNWKTRGVSKQAVLNASRIIGCRAEWIESGNGEMTDRVSRSSYRHLAEPTAQYASTPPNALEVKGRVPLISWVNAGVWSEAVDIYEPGYAERWMPFLKNEGRNVFALRVEGDSMTAKFGKSYPDGCIIFVDPDQRMPENGDRIVAKLEGAQQVTFKVFTTDAGRCWLRPLNDSHPPIYDSFTVVGKVIGKWEDE